MRGRNDNDYHCRGQNFEKRLRHGFFERRHHTEARKQKVQLVNTLFNFFENANEGDVYPSDFASIFKFVDDNGKNKKGYEDEGISTTLIHFNLGQDYPAHDEGSKTGETVETENSHDNELTDTSDSESEDDIDNGFGESSDDDLGDSSDDDFEQISDAEIVLEAPTVKSIELSSEDEKDNGELNNFLDTLNDSESIIEHSISIFERLSRHSNGEYSDEDISSSTPSDSNEVSTDTLILRSRIKVLEHLQDELESQYAKLDSLANPTDSIVKRFKQVLIGKAVEYAYKSEQLANSLKKRVVSIKGKSINSSRESSEEVLAQFSNTESDSDESSSSSDEYQIGETSASKSLKSSKPTIRRILVETLTDAALSE